MLLNFYLACLSFILFFLIVALVRQNKETIIRALTLLILLHTICLVIWQGTLAFSLFVIVVLTFSLYEIIQNYQINYLVFWLISFILLILGLYSDRTLLIFDNLPFIELASFFVIITSCLAFKADEKTIKSSFYSLVFSVCFLIPCSIFSIKLFALNTNAIIMIILLLQLNDAFGYLFGKQFGTTKLFPEISPNKTLEGYLFGGVGILIGILLLHTYIPILSKSVFYQDIILFFTILILGNIGDLILSSLKRKLEIKDFSKILPGHGGILDRFDNFLFIAPFFYIMMNHHLIL